MSLPIDQHKKSILYLLENHRILLIVGETGSGKSTQIPQILFSAGKFGDTTNPKVIGITQPRRVAAIQLAQKVAQDLNCRIGSTVGYAVRFKDVTTAGETLIKFLTEGLLIREMMIDPLLRKYSVIMVDEVHERNLNTDILLGLLKCIMVKRIDLKMIICSATLNVDSIRKFFTYSEKASIHAQLSQPGILAIQGKVCPLKFYYREEPVANYMEASIETVINLHETNRLASGNVLIFLTGQDEVDYVCSKLNDYALISSSRHDLRKLVVLPLHGSLKPDDISKVFDHHGRNTRVCIVSTNIAETSLTIDDIAFVIDCGFTKLRIFDHTTGVDSLVIVPISKSSAKQRAGRAGRTRDGIVYRLYPEVEYGRLDENPVPEIQRTSLTETIILLKSLGVSKLQNFPLISPMIRENLVVALELLYALGAIDNSGHLTRNGQIMAQFSLDPKISKILISQDTRHCTIEACRIAAMLQVKDIFVKPRGQASSLWLNTNLTGLCVSEGDLTSYLNIFNGFISNDKNQKWAERRNLNYQALLNAIEISKKLESQLRRCGVELKSCNGHVETIKRSIVSGLFANAAYLHPCGDYKTIKGNQTVYIHPTSVFSEMIDRPKFVLYVEILNSTKVYMRHITSIEQNSLLDAAPHFYTFATSLEMQRDIR